MPVQLPYLILQQYCLAENATLALMFHFVQRRLILNHSNRSNYHWYAV